MKQFEKDIPLCEVARALHSCTCVPLCSCCPFDRQAFLSFTLHAWLTVHTVFAAAVQCMNHVHGQRSRLTDILYAGMTLQSSDASTFELFIGLST